MKKELVSGQLKSEFVTLIERLQCNCRIDEVSGKVSCVLSCSDIGQHVCVFFSDKAGVLSGRWQSADSLSHTYRTCWAKG